MTIKVLLLSLAFQISTYAQNEAVRQVDSLNHWVESHINNTTDSLAIYKNSQTSLKLSKSFNYDLGLAHAYFNLGNYHKLYSRLDSSLVYYNLAKDLLKAEQKTQKEAEVYLEIANVNRSQGDHTAALDAVFKALELFEDTAYKKGIANCYTQICDLLYYENKFNESVSWCDKAIAIQEEQGFIEDLGVSLRYKASSELFDDNDLSYALATINSALKLYKDHGETGIPYLAALNGRGNILKYMERYDEALADYQLNYDSYKALGLDRYTIYALANMGHVYLLQEDYAKALPYKLETLEIMKTNGLTNNLWENYLHVSEIYEQLNDYKNSLAYHKLYAENYEAYQQSIVDRIETEAQIKYETGQKDGTIAIQNLKIEQQSKTNQLYLGIAVLLALLLFGLFYYYKKRQQKNRLLLHLNQELEIKNKQNELLLKEIHHRVKNNLEMVQSLIELQSASMPNSKSRDAMLASQNRVQSMGIIHQKLYQGENLGYIEMKDYFKNLAEVILDVYNADDRITIECAMEQLELDIDTAVPIGLIVNELLTNALKYAFPKTNSGNINIQMAKTTPNELTLKVIDDGVGKNPSAQAKGTGFGSQLIDLLVRQLDGEKQEHYEHGTSVSFKFKIKNVA
ncbi:histidine kinase dimerization/phosphoacceptor domain -containing protein [Geojedonia litorea]|uniref:histidine kinase n=1 Tax=Geojedonia litorea TaxID=1268269 RepID=A0ABV9N907_9FLAO